MFGIGGLEESEKDMTKNNPTVSVDNLTHHQSEQANPPQTQGNSAAYDQILKEVREENRPHFKTLQDAYHDVAKGVDEAPIKTLGTGAERRDRHLLKGAEHAKVYRAYRRGCEAAEHIKSETQKKLTRDELPSAPKDSNLWQVEKGLDAFTGLSTLQTGSALPEATTKLYHNMARIFIAFNLLDDDGETQKATQDANRLPPAAEKAYQSYDAAIKQNPDLSTDQEVYERLTEYGDPDYGLPSFETWSRHLRSGRTFYDAHKNTPRAGRAHGPSIVRANEI